MQPATRSAPVDSTLAGRRLWLAGSLLLLSALLGDAVGVVIPLVIAEFSIDLRSAGALQYVPAACVACSSFALLFMVDRLGCRRTVMLGLLVYCCASALLWLAAAPLALVIAMIAAGIGMAVWKIGVYVLIGHISADAARHSHLMNTVEGSYAVGAIAAPLAILSLSRAELSWKWLYVCGALAALLLAIAAARLMPRPRAGEHAVSLPGACAVLSSGRAWNFCSLLGLYVAVEMIVAVWLPAYLMQLGATRAVAAWALTAFFAMRAVGRFAGPAVLRRVHWAALVRLCGVLVALSIVVSLLGGFYAALLLLPLSGLFMSILFPTLNSRVISSFPPASQGAVAGLTLLCAAGSAALGSWSLAAVGDATRSLQTGMWIGAGLGILLAVGLTALARSPHARGA